MKKKFVHSFYSRPLSGDLFELGPIVRLMGNIYYYALSVAYAKRSGASIVLHTDSFGAKMFSDIPYDDIIVDLDEIPVLNRSFFAAAKMWAMANEDLGSIHIDGDVFIKNEQLVDNMFNTPYDVIVQSFEPGEWYINIIKKLQKFGDPRILSRCGIITNPILSYNTGVLGFKNEKLKEDFINTYKYLVKYYSDHGMVVEKWDAPDIVLEQLGLYSKVQDGSYKVMKVLNSPYSKEPAEIGYQHVLTSKKFSELDKCRDLLKVMDKDTYEKIEKMGKHLICT